MTSSYLRARAIAETNRDIAYLNEQADKTGVVRLKRAIDALPQEQIIEKCVSE